MKVINLLKLAVASVLIAIWKDITQSLTMYTFYIATFIRCPLSKHWSETNTEHELLWPAKISHGCAT